MKLEHGKSYRYTTTVKVGRQCKRMKRTLDVVYIGKEGSKEVFETETGQELLVHVDDVNEHISEIEGC